MPIDGDRVYADRKCFLSMTRVSMMMTRSTPLRADSPREHAERAVSKVWVGSFLRFALRDSLFTSVRTWERWRWCRESSNAGRDVMLSRRGYADCCMGRLSVGACACSERGAVRNSREERMVCVDIIVVVGIMGLR